MPRRAKKTSRASRPKKSSDSEALAQWQKRIFAVDTETQELLNQFYRDGTHKGRFRFGEGDAVISLSKGLYHQATVFRYYRSTLPDTLFQNAKLPDVAAEDRVPTFIVSFSGWSHKYDEEIPENEIISRIPSELCHIQGVLFAHEWNTFERTKLGMNEEKTGKSAWFLTNELYAKLEKKWQNLTGKTVAFSTYAGRTAADAGPSLKVDPMEADEEAGPSGEEVTSGGEVSVASDNSEEKEEDGENSEMV